MSIIRTRFPANLVSVHFPMFPAQSQGLKSAEKTNSLPNALLFKEPSNPFIKNFPLFNQKLFLHGDVSPPK